MQRRQVKTRKRTIERLKTNHRKVVMVRVKLIDSRVVLKLDIKRNLLK